ncbi:MAG: site-specific integrase [Desulfosarcina sp.]|nr:site-specific integrase [Desulfosarcina sp.]
MGFYRDPKRKDWVYRFQFRGNQYGGRGYKTKGAAVTAREDHRKKLNAEPAPEKTATAFSVVANEYLDEANRRFAKKTYQGKGYCYRIFMESLGGDRPITDISSVDVDRFLKTRPSNNNFNVHRKDLLALFHFARKRKYIMENPVNDIDKMPHTPGRKVIPTEEQVIALILVADPVDEKPLLLTILHTLARVDEILRLTWEDINFERKTVTLWTRKRKGGAYEADPMPMNKDLHGTLKALFKKREQTTWVFLNPKTMTRYTRRPKLMKGLCMRAFDPACKKLADYTGPVFGFHALRHFAASLLADREKFSTKTVQKLLRHKESRTTEIYLHTLGDGMREAAATLEGKFTMAKTKQDDAAEGR